MSLRLVVDDVPVQGILSQQFDRPSPLQETWSLQSLDVVDAVDVVDVVDDVDIRDVVDAA